MKLSNRLFDILKWLAIVGLPAIEAFIAALFPIWGIPYAAQIVDTLVAVHLLLGALLGISNAQYNASKAGDSEDAYKELIYQNNELREELVSMLEKTFESSENEPPVYETPVQPEEIE